MKLKKIILEIFSITLIFANFLFAGETGKISGKVIDKKTNEPLPGVNILIEGTSIGAATDLNGEYFILQIPPGTYSLRASMIGYQNIIIENVLVRADHTTIINFEMEEITYELEKEVVVVAERPVIQKDLTASIQFVGKNDLERLPITDVKEGLMIQAGVFFDPIPVAGGLGSAGKGEARFSIRGGSQEEIKWYIDGVRNSPLVWGRADWGISVNNNINKEAVQEIQVMTGGFNAEYGDAQSGIINVITKEGSDKFHFSIEYVYGVPGQHHFGNYLYDKSNQKEFLNHTLPDGSLDPAWWTPFRQSQIYDYTDIPDHSLYTSLSGSLFKIKEEKIRFFISSQFKQQAYIYPHPRDSRDMENAFINLSYRFPKMKIRLTGSYNHDAHSTLQENGDFTNQVKYYRGWGSLLDTYTYNLNGNFTHAISSNLFYELKLSYFNVENKEHPSDYLVLGKSKSPTIWGFQRFDGFENEPFDNYSYIYDTKLLTGDISLIGNLSWQFDKNNLLKTGLEFRYNTFDEKQSYRFPSFTMDKRYWLNKGLDESFHPIQFSYYLQDKMEFESMILNLGVRFDYFNPNRDWFKSNNLFNLAVDPQYNKNLDLDGDQIDDNGHIKYSFENVLKQPREKAKSYTMISPRFGVSFPVTENTLLHFNYGHFYQMPPLDQLFEFSYFKPLYLVEAQMAEDKLAQQEGREPKHIASNDGDPERVVAYTFRPLKPQKTIMFEVGVKQNFVDLAALEIIAFYKDVFDQTEERVGLFDRSVYGYDPFIKQTTPNQAYTSYFSGDYGDSRGFEISLKSNFSRIFMIDLNYSFSRSVQGRGSPRRINIDSSGNMTYDWDTQVEKRIPIEKSYSRPHILRANLFLNYPNNLFNLFVDKIFNNSSVSILFRFVSGQAFTYLSPDDPPDTYNNHRYPSSKTFDLKLEKSLTIAKSHNFIFYTQITNLFNAKNVRSIGDVLFDANAVKKYIETGKVSTVDADGYDIGWQTYFEKRRIYIGVRYSF